MTKRPFFSTCGVHPDGVEQMEKPVYFNKTSNFTTGESAFWRLSEIRKNLYKIKKCKKECGTDWSANIQI